jgi:hypothetical protein
MHRYWVHQMQITLTIPDKILSTNFSIFEEQKFSELMNNRSNIINFLKKEFLNKKEKLFEKLELNNLINEIKSDPKITSKIKSKRPEMAKNHCYRFNTFRCDFFDQYFYASELDYYKLVDDVKRIVYNMSEENLVDELIFCGLERTQSYEEYLFKKIFEKLHFLNSEKNAIELLNGDFDKSQIKKKKSKRKSQKSNESKNYLH